MHGRHGGHHHHHHSPHGDSAANDIFMAIADLLGACASNSTTNTTTTTQTVQVVQPVHVFPPQQQVAEETSITEENPAETEALPNNNGPTFEEFKRAYDRKYRGTLFSNPNSEMKRKLKNETCTTIEEVRNYAQQHPNSRTAEVLKSFRR